MEALLQEEPVSGSLARFVHVVNAPDGPRMDGRIEIGKFPLVRRYLTTRMLKLFEQQEKELFLRIFWIDQRQGNSVKCKVPSGEPGIFPLVWHRKNAHRVEVSPVSISNRQARGRLWVVRIVTVQPFAYIEKINLFRP